MTRPLLVPVLLGFGFSLLLASSSCVGLCKDEDKNCDEGAANAGAAGSSAPTTCPQLTALLECLDLFCATASNPFCTCHAMDKDLSADCKCVPITLDPADYCKAAIRNGVDAASFDCAAATDGIKTMCIGVQ